MKRIIITILIMALAAIYAQGPTLDTDVISAKKTFRKAKTNKIMISDFAVFFATFNSQAKKAGSGSNVSVNVWLKDYDQNTMQSITDAIYQKFVNDLQAHGFELVDAKELKGTRPGKKFNLVQGGGEPVPIKIKKKKQGINMEYMLFTPNGLTYLSDGRKKDGMNNLGMKTSMKLSQAYEALDVMAVTATFNMDFIDFNSKGGFFSESASVSARPALNGESGNTMSLNFVHKYVPGMINVFLKERYASPMDLTGEMVETKSSSFLGSAFANYDFKPDNLQEAAREYLNKIENAMLNRLLDELKNAGEKKKKK